MLHYKVKRVLPKEQYARTVVNKFFSYGASAHRLGQSTRFVVLIPIKRPERKEALLKMLVRNSLGEEFDLVDVFSMDGGPQFRLVHESELDARGRLPTEGQPPADYVASDDSDWLEAS